jgi:hypothetical protein
MAEPDDLLLPIPDRVEATYLVPTARSLPDPLAPARDAARLWFEPLQQHLTWLIRAGEQVVRTLPAAAIPLDVARFDRASEVQRRRVAEATQIFVVTVADRPGWPPLPDWTARAIAAALAEHVGADVVDDATHQLLDARRCLLTLPNLAGEVRLDDWIRVTNTTQPAGYRVATTGLRRFGLPELQSLATPPNIAGQFGRALSGVSRRLIAQWSRALADTPDAAFASLPASVQVGPADVAAAGRRAPLHTAAGPRPVRIRLGHEPGADVHQSATLTVLPPLNWSGSSGEHLASVCADLFGARPTTVRHARRGERMEQAIASARAGLTRIRDRFESGDLTRHTKLLVKYALTADAGTEYMWAYVTSWRDPYRILATSSADGIYHPKVRLGRPVVVDTAAVVDWAVEHDERGIIEGYWTEAALDEA